MYIIVIYNCRTTNWGQNMADTIKNIPIYSGDYIDIYSLPQVIAAGIVVGDKIIVTNVGGGRFKLNSGTDQPTDESGYVWCNPSDEKTNSSGDSKAWAYSAQYNSEFNIRKAL